MKEALIALAVIGGGYAVSWWFGRRRRARHPFISLAVFTSRRPALDVRTLRNAAESAWQVRFPQEKDATDWVVGEPPLLMVKAAGFHFIANVHGRPYYAMGQTPSAEPPPGFPTHEGWISIDLVSTDETKSEGETYARIGKLTNALLDGDAVALFMPSRAQVFTLDQPDRIALVRAALQSDTVLEALSRLAAANEPAAPPAVADGRGPR